MEPKCRRLAMNCCTSTFQLGVQACRYLSAVLKKKKEKREGEGGGGGEEEANASPAQGSMEVHITLVIFSYLWLESFAAPIH